MNDQQLMQKASADAAAARSEYQALSATYCGSKGSLSYDEAKATFTCVPEPVKPTPATTSPTK